LLELETTVERVEKENGEWVIALRKVLKGRNYWWRETFDAVVVASGHYNVPWFPKVEGLLEFDRRFPGAIHHSKHFREGSKYRGKVSTISDV
jgi:cation diffusion facilitator CzcD-associated flavoprotein CzcO